MYENELHSTSLKKCIVLLVMPSNQATMQLQLIVVFCDFTRVCDHIQVKPGSEV